MFIVIFTASTKEYADPILNDIDPNNCISHRLYRHHTHSVNDLNSSISYIKDLSKINRNLEKSVIVDNLQENFIKQQSNGIKVRDWYDDYSDSVLRKLSVLLIQIAKMRPKNITHELKLYRSYIKQHIQ